LFRLIKCFKAKISQKKINRKPKNENQTKIIKDLLNINMTTVKIFIQKRYAEGSNLRYPAMAKKKLLYNLAQIYE